MRDIILSYGFAGEKPLVECSFITEFEDHIFVTVDAEAFFFLHDLITSYVKEKERVVRSRESNYFLGFDSSCECKFYEIITLQHTMQNMSARAHSPDPQERKGASTSTANASNVTVSSEDDKKRKQFDPAEMFIKDWRSYRCKTWHLEPTVR